MLGKRWEAQAVAQAQAVGVAIPTAGTVTVWLHWWKTKHQFCQRILPPVNFLKEDIDFLMHN